jgi:hypothetical protein
MLRRLLALIVFALAMLAFGGAALVAAQAPDRTGPGVAALDTAPDVCVMSFTDVPQGSTFYPYIECLYCRNIVGGYPDNTFRPNADVTRGQLSKIVAQSMGLNGNPGLQLFEDVPPGTTFYTDINNLTQVGFINGYPCQPSDNCITYSRVFRPNSPASRAQIAKIVTQAAGWYDVPVSQLYEDVAPGSTFYDYVERLSMHNAATGYPCGGTGEPCDPGNLPYFRPSSNVTRGQLSKIDVTAFFPVCLMQQK